MKVHEGDTKARFANIHQREGLGFKAQKKYNSAEANCMKKILMAPRIEKETGTGDLKKFF